MKYANYLQKFDLLYRQAAGVHTNQVWINVHFLNVILPLGLRHYVDRLRMQNCHSRCYEPTKRSCCRQHNAQLTQAVRMLSGQNLQFIGHHSHKYEPVAKKFSNTQSAS